MMTAEEAKAKRDALLEKAAQQSARKHTHTVSFGGDDYEIRQMTVGTRNRLLKKAEDTATKFNLLAIIESVYVPGTDSRLFDANNASHMAILINQGSGGLTDALASGINKLVEEAQEEGKKYEGVQSDS